MSPMISQIDDIDLTRLHLRSADCCCIDMHDRSQVCFRLCKTLHACLQQDSRAVRCCTKDGLPRGQRRGGVNPHRKVKLHGIIRPASGALEAWCILRAGIPFSLARLGVLQSSNQLLRELLSCRLARIGRRHIAGLPHTHWPIAAANHLINLACLLQIILGALPCQQCRHLDRARSMFRQLHYTEHGHNTITSSSCVLLTAVYPQHRQLRTRGHGIQHEPHCGCMLHREPVSAAFDEHHVRYLRIGSTSFDGCNPLPLLRAGSWQLAP